MEDQIQFTNIFKTLIQGLHKNLDEVQDSKFALWRIHTEHKVECGIVPVDQLVVRATDQTSTFQEVTDVVISLEN